MTLLQVSDRLAQEIRHEADTRGLSIEKFLQVAVQRERTLATRQQIEQEQQWWLQRPLSIRAQYEGQYIAVYHQELVDHDPNEAELFQRIRAKYGKQPVLIMPAEGPKEITILSPRVEIR
ncbi:MAG: hypothetical protein H6658_16750 [Ardenticatenaceae bacterium]|nr:hypothetical protein [Ardenticatenaceae bacterium]